MTHLLKGALAVYPSDERGKAPYIIGFQYNPEQMKRTLALRAPGQGGASPGGAKEDARRAAGPPVETINLTIQLDAAGRLSKPQTMDGVRENGLHADLATLEMLLYPSTALIDRTTQLASKGQVQINPASVPLTLLVWGRSRVVPVMITSFSVSEEAFDENLNPILAKVDLGLKVLTYLELKPDTIGYEAYMAYQQSKQNLARQDAADGQMAGLLPPRS